MGTIRYNIRKPDVELSDVDFCIIECVPLLFCVVVVVVVVMVAPSFPTSVFVDRDVVSSLLLGVCFATRSVPV